MQPPKVWAAAVISVLDFFFVQHFDNPRGVPDRYGIVRNVLCDHGGRAHDGMTLRMVCHTPETLHAYQVDWNMFYQETKPHE